MSLFSPITERSWPVRVLLAAIYGVLAAGSLTMAVPLLATLAGSTAGEYDAGSLSLFPRFLLDDQALWGRYLEAKYGGSLDDFKMGWGDPGLDFFSPPVLPAAGSSARALRLWTEFRAAHGPLTPQEAGLGFTRSTKQYAALENRLFRRWLQARYGTDARRLDAALLLEVAEPTEIVPPVQSRLFVPDVDDPLNRAFLDYLGTVPEARRLVWNAGNLFRAAYLPRAYGTVSAYNAAFGTRYGSLQEIPFPETVPAEGAAAWTAFVQRVLNPEFVVLDGRAEEARAAAGLGHADFVRSRARAADLRVATLDAAFAAWAAERGVPDARIPQAALDAEQFRAEKGFWCRQFALQNFVYVLDEVMIQGNGVRNTAILVVLTVLGALTVNPLAAYALSRYRLPQTYHLLLFFMATIAFPAEVTMIPGFLQLKELGLLNTFGALVLPGLVNGFSIFLLKGFFDSLPRELYEAADIDGANEWQIFWGITMTLSRPILAVLALNAFVSAYSAFFFALILAPDQRMWTLMVWIYQLGQSAGPGIVYASLLLTALPILAVYLCAQNVILRGIVVPTEK